MITNEEFEKLRAGDTIYVPFTVHAVEGVRVHAYLSDVPEEKISSYMQPFLACDISSWRPTHRVFRCGDLVRWKRREYLVETDEDAQERVYIVDTATRHVKANELQLLMTVDEVRELKREGGDDA